MEISDLGGNPPPPRWQPPSYGGGCHPSQEGNFWGTRQELANVAIVLMGVSGSGKSTVGRALAAALDCSFIEGDDHHPPGNVEKMSAGVSLTDEDRLPWLRDLAEAINAHLTLNEQVVVTCSALKRSYRDLLRTSVPQLRLIYLQGDYDTIAQRLATRGPHFMPPALLQSQFDGLEVPSAQEALILSIKTPIADLVAAILATL